jgi:hypothetical protein
MQNDAGTAHSTGVGRDDLTLGADGLGGQNGNGCKDGEDGEGAQNQKT